MTGTVKMLSEACTAGNFSTVNILLDAGADVTVVDNDGVTALMSAASQGHAAIVRYFLLRITRLDYN